MNPSDARHKSDESAPLRRIDASRWTRDFDAQLAPIATVYDTPVAVQTHCCALGAVNREVQTEADAFYVTLDYTPGMPVTGPLAIEGAQVGQLIAIDILGIELEHQGWTMAMAGRGVVGSRVTGAASRLGYVEGEHLRFLDRLKLPLRPMVGCLGVTPPGAPLRAGWPGVHGGNLDCTLLGPGATLYLPVLVPEAMICLGDLHAAMGDGEVGMAGLEIGGIVTLRVRRLAAQPWPLPFVTTEQLAATIHSAPTLDEAAIGATQMMAELLETAGKVSAADAAMLLSLAGDLRICQVVNPLKTCRLEVPLSLLVDLGIDLPKES